MPFAVGVSGLATETLEIPVNTVSGVYSLQVHDENQHELVRAEQAVEVTPPAEYLHLTGPTEDGTVNPGEHVTFAGKVGAAAVVVGGSLRYYRGDEELDVDYVSLVSDGQGNLAGEAVVSQVKTAERVVLQVELADRTGARETIESAPLGIGAISQARVQDPFRPVLRNKEADATRVRWGSTIEWEAQTVEGAELVWAFVVQLNVWGDLEGEQFDVAKHTVIDIDGLMKGRVRLDFLGARTTDVYFWTEFRRPDGTSVRSASAVVKAVQPRRRIDFLMGEAARWLSGVKQPVDMAPMLHEGRVFVSMRHAAEPLGADFRWEAGQEKVTMVRGATKVELWVGRSDAKVDGVWRAIDPTNSKVVPQNIAGRVLVPLRFVAEALGVTVEWVEREQRIVIIEE